MLNLQVVFVTVGSEVVEDWLCGVVSTADKVSFN